MKDECKIIKSIKAGVSRVREDECKIMYKEYQGWSFTCEGG